MSWYRFELARFAAASMLRAGFVVALKRRVRTLRYTASPRRDDTLCSINPSPGFRSLGRRAERIAERSPGAGTRPHIRRSGYSSLGTRAHPAHRAGESNALHGSVSKCRRPLPQHVSLCSHRVERMLCDPTFCPERLELASSCWPKHGHDVSPRCAARILARNNRLRCNTLTPINTISSKPTASLTGPTADGSPMRSGKSIV